MAKKEEYSLIIQHIIFYWNKQHRAAKYASIREKQPKALEIPKEYFIHNRDYGFPIHKVMIVQNDSGLETKINKIEFSNYQGLIRLDGIDILPNEKPIGVFYRYSAALCGAPARYDRKNSLLNERAFDLYDEEFGRIEHNGRFSDADTGEWFYKKDIINICLSKENNQYIFDKLPISKNYKQIALLK